MSSARPPADPSASAAAAAGAGFVSYRPAAVPGAAASMSDSGALLRRSKSIGTQQQQPQQQQQWQEDEEKDGAGTEYGGRRKRQKLDEHRQTPTPNDGALGASGALDGDHGAADDDGLLDADALAARRADEDDFFALMDGPLVVRPGGYAAITPRATTAEAAAASAAAAGSDGPLAALDVHAQWAEMTFGEAPLDWNIHTRVRVTSDFDFAWAAAPSALAEAEGLAAYHAQSPSLPCTCLPPPMPSDPIDAPAPAAPVDLLRELHHALCYSIFPAAPWTRGHPLTLAIQTALNKPADTHSPMDRFSLQHLRREWVRWEESFRALYQRTRLPPGSPAWLDHFYTVHRGGGGRTGSALSFVVLFLAADAEPPPDPATLQAGEPVPDTSPAAIISRSNRALRAMLAAKRVQFTMPNSAAWPQVQQFASQQQQQQQQQTGATPRLLERSLSEFGGAGEADAADTVGGSSAASKAAHARWSRLLLEEDGTAASVLLVRGRAAVHALYDALLNQERERRELDMPTLLASAPFLNASTQQVNVVKVGPIVMANTQAAASSAEPALRSSSNGLSKAPPPPPIQPPAHGSSLVGLHTLELSGPLLPHSVVRLLSLLRRSQHGSFHAVFAPAEIPAGGGGSHLNAVADVLQMDSLRCHTDAPPLALCKQPTLAKHSASLLHGKQSIRTVGALKRVKTDGQHHGLHFLVELA